MFGLIRQKGYFVTYIWIIVSLIFVFILWSIIEHRIIVTSRYKITSQVINDNQQELSFIVLADLHNKGFGKNNKILLQKILEQKPNFVIIAGDLITKRKPCYPGKAYELIKELISHCPVYYAYGNHEQYFEDITRIRIENLDKEQMALSQSWLLYKDRLLKLGVHILDNESVLIYNNRIRITGLSIPSDYYVKGKPPVLELEEITSKIGTRKSEYYQILIAHNPVYFNEYISFGADLILSGHIHGGLIRLPFIGGVISPQIRLFPKYDSGKYTVNNKHMIVSRGIGNHSFMPRFLNPSEIINISLKKAE